MIKSNTTVSKTLISLLFSAITLSAIIDVKCAETPSNYKNKSISFSSIHGDLIIDDPLAIDLIESPLMQRLKAINQYGVNEFIFPPKAYHYTRFDHCLGVYQILKDRGAPRLEQIAGLLHDASHTVFSHTMDVLFMGGMNKGGYQDSIHAQFLETYGATEILAKYNVTINDILPDQPNFKCLEQPHPGLCADRVEYILHAADLEDMMPLNDIQKTHKDLQFDGENWFFQTPEIAEKFAFVSLNQTLNTWGSPANLLVANWITDITRIMWDHNEITHDDIHFNLKDEDLWEKIKNSTDQSIQTLLNKAVHFNDQFDLLEEDEPESTNQSIHFAKFRGVDPFVRVDKKLIPLTQISKKYNQDYNAVKQHIKTGWRIRFK